MANPLQILEDEIGRRLRESEASGELRQAASYGKALRLADGYDETPEDLRMAFKILKDSGFVPAEVEMMRKIAGLRDTLARSGDGPDEQARLRRELGQLEVSLALAKDRLNGKR